MFESVCVQRGEDLESLLVLIVQIRTGDVHVSKMLAIAMRIITGPADSLEAAKRFVRVYLMAVSLRSKATSHFLWEQGVVAIRLKYSKRTLVGDELCRIDCRILWRLHRC